jgi:hypothetical protein
MLLDFLLLHLLQLVVQGFLMLFRLVYSLFSYLLQLLYLFLEEFFECRYLKILVDQFLQYELGYFQLSIFEHLEFSEL